MFIVYRVVIIISGVASATRISCSVFIFPLMSCRACVNVCTSFGLGTVRKGE